MLTLAARMSRAKPSAIMVVADKARQLKAAGRDIVNFSIGVPNFLPGAHVYDAAREALTKDSGRLRFQSRQRRAARRVLRAPAPERSAGLRTQELRGRHRRQAGALQPRRSAARSGRRDRVPDAVLDQLCRYRRDPRRENHPVAVSAGAELQADSRAARCRAGEQAESVPVQQSVQSDRHGLHARTRSPRSPTCW